MRLLSALCLVGILAWSNPLEAAVNVTVTFGTMYAYAQDFNGNVDRNREYGQVDVSPVVTGPTTLTGDIGSAKTTLKYQFSNAGTEAVIRFDASLALRPQGNYAQVNWTVEITTTETMKYTVTGSMSGGSSDSRDQYELFTALHLGNANKYLERESDFFGAADPLPVAVSYVLDGDQEGSLHTHVGTRTGTILGGSWDFSGQMSLLDYTKVWEGDSQASGFVQITLRPLNAPDPEPTQTTPEPSTLVMFGMAVAGLGVQRWRKRRVKE